MGKNLLILVSSVVAVGWMLIQWLRWRRSERKEGFARGGRLLLLALVFSLLAPVAMVLSTPPRVRHSLAVCADDELAQTALKVLAERGPWEHSQFGVLEVVLQPLVVRFGGREQPVRLFLPERDGTFLLDVAGLEPLADGAEVDGVQLSLECRPMQGYQVGAEVASLSLDGGDSFSWWASSRGSRGGPSEPDEGGTGEASKTR